MATMQVEHINPFIRALQNTFETMLSCQARRGALAVKEGNLATHDISGVIGLSGKAVGSVVMSLTQAVAMKAASTMLMMDVEQVDEDVLDAVGELTNMVGGAAKAELEEYELKLGLPNVVTGAGHEVHFPTNVTPITIAFETDWGPLALEIGLTTV